MIQGGKGFGDSMMLAETGGSQRGVNSSVSRARTPWMGKGSLKLLACPAQSLTQGTGESDQRGPVLPWKMVPAPPSWGPQEGRLL